MNANSSARVAFVAKLSAVMLTVFFLTISFELRFHTANGVYIAQGRTIAQDAKQNPSKVVDPAAWGSNHAGKSVPEFVHGDECLFCHRNTIGATWQDNAHGVTVRQREDAPEFRGLVKEQPKLNEFAEQIEYFLGSRHHVRFMKKNGYGKFAILNSKADLNAEHKVEKWEAVEKPDWDNEKFANKCAGCHSTGIDPETKAFSGFGLDCYTCHGDVDLDHSNDTSKVLLSKKRRNDAKVINSICAQCHLRGSSSQSTGLPYPNNFIAGDNLFQDLKVEWAKAEDPNLNPGDRHIWRNVRDVALNGDESITCLSCHQVHTNSSLRHRRVLRAPICAECHSADSFKNPRPYIMHSSLCEY